MKKLERKTLRNVKGGVVLPEGLKLVEIGALVYGAHVKQSI
ncbi:hypothetical protein ACH34I_14365 [Elizabethkingia anophelis]